MTRNGPTEKQITFILGLISARHESDAYREIGKDMNCSMSAAMRRATKWHASTTIDRLKSVGRETR